MLRLRVNRSIRVLVRATRAYAAGFGTAGSLLAGAAVLFLLAAAVVGFRGWPTSRAGVSPIHIVVGHRPPAGSAVAGRLRALVATGAAGTAGGAGAAGAAGASAEAPAGRRSGGVAERARSDGAPERRQARYDGHAAGCPGRWHGRSRVRFDRWIGLRRRLRSRHRSGRFWVRGLWLRRFWLGRFWLGWPPGF